MRRAVAVCLACLPFDAQSRRVLDETLCDWAFEDETADTPCRRGVVCARSLAGVGRAVIHAVALEVGRIPGGWLASRLALAVAVPAIILASFGWGHVPAPRALSWLQWLELTGLVLPQAAIATLPLALFAVVARSSRTIPALGLAAAALTGALLLGGLVLPVASRGFHVAAYALGSNRDSASAARRLPYGPTDFGPFDLIVKAIDGPAGPFMGAALFKTGLAAMAAVFVLVGSAVTRISGTSRRSWIALIAGTYGVVIVLIPSEWELGGHAPAPAGLVPWCIAFGALIGAVALQRMQPSEGEMS